MNKISQIDLELGKIPPQAIDLEEAVLGALMIEKDAIDNVINLIKPESFYKEEHQKIYQAIYDLSKKDIGIDILTVTEQLRKNKQLEEVGGPLYVTQLTARISSAANIVDHALIVQEKYIKRELIRTSQELSARSFDDEVDTKDIIDYANKLNDDLNELVAGKQQIRRLDDVLDQSLSDALKRKEQRSQGKKIGIEPPLQSLKDKIYYWANDLIIIAARPSEGKTNLGLHIAKEAAENGNAICIYSLETDAVKLGDRYILAESNVNDYDFRAGYLNDEQIKDLGRAKEKLSELPIYIDDNAAVTCDYIRTHSRLMRKKRRCDLIIIDYLQLTEIPYTRGKTLAQQINEITKAFKNHARKMGVPVIVLCQMNREIERSGGGRKPRLSDLKESSGIEQDAYMVIFIWTPSRYGIDEIDNKPTKGTTHLIIAKNKDGKVGEIIINEKYGLRYIWDVSILEPAEDKKMGKDAQIKEEFDEENDLPF